jgi:hypothetical protein
MPIVIAAVSSRPTPATTTRARLIFDVTRSTLSPASSVRVVIDSFFEVLRVACWSTTAWSSSRAISTTVRVAWAGFFATTSIEMIGDRPSIVTVKVSLRPFRSRLFRTSSLRTVIITASPSASGPRSAHGLRGWPSWSAVSGVTTGGTICTWPVAL